MSALGAFNTQLIRFFEELCETYPEEKAIKGALEALYGAKKINPKLIVDLFYEHVYKELNEPIMNEDSELVVAVAKAKISNQFNEMISALAIFDKYWDTMGQKNQDVIWQYLNVLCVLCEKARST